MTIQAKVATILKARLVPSGQLQTGEKVNIYKGQALQIKKVTPAKNQHLYVEFVDPDLKAGYLYAPHWNYQEERIILPASYYYQTDNPSGEGYRECCGTSNAIMLNNSRNGWLDAQAKEKGRRQPESIYLDQLALHGDTTNHDANTRALRDLGVDSYWSTSLTLEDLYLSIRNGIVLVVGLDYKGPDHGHIVAVVGIDIKKRTVIVHDPYGAREGPSNSWIVNEINANERGKFDVYSLDTFEYLWFPEGSRGWGRIVTHIMGVPTVFADI